MLLTVLSAQLAYADIAPDPTPVDAFTDVTVRSTYYDAVSYLKNEGIISGYEDNSFKPYATINRAEFTKIIVGATRTTPDNGLCLESYAKADGTYNNLFTDITIGAVGTNAWYVDYIWYAKDHILINGYPDGSFKPDETINFVEAAKILGKAFNIVPANSQTASTQPWYKNYVEVLANYKAIPTTITKFDQKITRGEMAEMAFRLKAGNTSLDSQTYANLY